MRRPSICGTPTAMCAGCRAASPPRRGARYAARPDRFGVALAAEGPQRQVGPLRAAPPHKLAEYYQTKAKMRTLEPTWEEETSFTISTERQILHIAVFDHDLTSEVRRRRRRHPRPRFTLTTASTACITAPPPPPHLHHSALLDDLIGELMIPVASVIAFPSHYANVDWPHQLTPSAEDQKKARDKASASVEEQKKGPTDPLGSSASSSPSPSITRRLRRRRARLLEQRSRRSRADSHRSDAPRAAVAAPGPHAEADGRPSTRRRTWSSSAASRPASPRARPWRSPTGAGPPKRKHDIGGAPRPPLRALRRPPARPPAHRVTCCAPGDRTLITTAGRAARRRSPARKLPRRCFTMERSRLADHHQRALHIFAESHWVSSATPLHYFVSTLSSDTIRWCRKLLQTKEQLDNERLGVAGGRERFDPLIGRIGPAAHRRGEGGPFAWPVSSNKRRASRSPPARCRRRARRTQRTFFSAAVAGGQHAGGDVDMRVRVELGRLQLQETGPERRGEGGGGGRRRRALAGASASTRVGVRERAEYATQEPRRCSSP